jgi:hypothetical protein
MATVNYGCNKFYDTGPCMFLGWDYTKYLDALSAYREIEVTYSWGLYQKTYMAVINSVM